MCPNNMSTHGKFIKKVKKRKKKSLLASWDKFTQVKGPFHVEEKPLLAAGEKKSNTILRADNKIAYFSRCF